MIEQLITDRTSADVARVIYLQSLNYSSMTTEEQAEWSSDLKGAYNISDLNRVGRVLNALRDMLASVCGIAVSIQAKTNWNSQDIPTAAQMRNYQDYVRQIRVCLQYPSTSPTAPSIRYLTYEQANDIERILQQCDQLITNLTYAFKYTGAAECATGGLL